MTIQPASPVPGLQNLLLLDRMNDYSQTDPLYPFALDELLCRSTGQGGPAICHIWRHERAFILGLRDSRLPLAGDASRWLESLGYKAAVRNSGGAAVPLDPGVVNISLILPKANTLDFHFHQDFELMYSLIRSALAGAGVPVDKGEIAGAYCPGDFDLSIDGFKFCGIAQRRQAHAYIVQAFVVAEGAGQERAALVRSFYERAAGGAEPGAHPLVESSSTASLEELVGLAQGGGAERFADAVKQIIRSGQTADGLAEAAARLQMPSLAQIEAMAQSLRGRYATTQA
ncbi:octanoyl-[GcvH]:protein N-octanoyltransferase [Paenibacillus algorifonticola]|uniref:Octanoyl-[GcvH]:protein N-octanoyltransferase n=1 Tax=Paenibacillus algorifonticola TaxID=684063 RepID=A0A1I2IKJ9_9BACL|nr:ligase [Paenibacillus algorifonticola]SFF41386.1 octanoyl-[GcvH]:protein N-octanoyltransferase [Paenibacillus algorifonticola]